MEALTIISAIASIIGAWIAYKQASKAKDSADEAKKVRAQLIDHRHASELSKIQASCRIALESMKMYGPAFTSSSLQGINDQNEGPKVQDLIFLLKEHREHFGNKKPNEADEFCDIVIPLLEDLSKSLTEDDRKKYGKQIVARLSSFTSIIKKRLEKKLYKAH